MTIDSYKAINIPPEVQSYANKPVQNETNKSGKVGILRLALEMDRDVKKTVIKEQFSQVPLFIQRAMYLEESLPQMAYVYIISPSGGILQGDRYDIDIKLGNNSLTHVTTQGATRIYKMENSYATQTISINAEDGSYLEYIPDQIIPFRKSRFYQQVELTVHDNATIIYSEVIVPGRIASGEKFEYDICYIRTVARNHLGSPRFMDTVKLEPKKEKLTIYGILEKFEVVGTIYLVTRENLVAELQNKINGKLKDLELSAKVSVGTSILPKSQGIMVRILGTSAEDVKNIIFEVVGIARKQIIGASFSGMRKA